jgi:hypothetical protein
MKLVSLKKNDLILRNCVVKINISYNFTPHENKSKTNVSIYADSEPSDWCERWNIKAVKLSISSEGLDPLTTYYNYKDQNFLL